jgi:hypothetical protein
MTLTEQRAFIGEVKLQTEPALHAFEMVNMLVNQLANMSPSEAHYSVTFNVVFKEVHGFLTHTSNTSKLFCLM